MTIIYEYKRVMVVYKRVMHLLKPSPNLNTAQENLHIPFNSDAMSVKAKRHIADSAYEKIANRADFRYLDWHRTKYQSTSKHSTRTITLKSSENCCKIVFIY